MIVEGVMGERRATNNVASDARFGPYSELIVGDAHGRDFESARLARLFTTMVKGVTIAATHNTPIAAATATPVIGILNPINNLKAMSIKRIGFLTTSGTPAGGQVVLNAIAGPGQSISAAVTGSIFAHILSAAASPQGSTMKPYNNVALTGLSPAVANEILLIGGAAAAAAAGNGGPGVGGEDLGGGIIVPPNTLLALMAGTGAGTTWIVNASITWEEIDWPL